MDRTRRQLRIQTLAVTCCLCASMLPAMSGCESPPQARAQQSSAQGGPHQMRPLGMSVPVSIYMAPIHYGETAYGIIHLHDASDNVTVSFSGDTAVLANSSAQSRTPASNFATFQVEATGGSPIDQTKYVTVTATGTGGKDAVRCVLVVMP